MEKNQAFADNKDQVVEEKIPQRMPHLGQQGRKRMPGWRLWLPLAFQGLLIFSVAAQPVYTYLTGKTVIIQTRPVDPYDLLRGYYQTLSYDISSRETLQELPGGKAVVKLPRDRKSETSFYVILEKPGGDKAGAPAAWVPVAVSGDRPKDLSGDRVALKGEFQKYGQILYGLETYYMPEDQRVEINREISQAQASQARSFVVEVKVDDRGNALPVSMWVGDHNYRF
ncbi:MAG: GDYXXLXY domain-containing protein [Hormoscilla sp.]